MASLIRQSQPGAPALGHSLLELLVAVAIVGIGALGAAKLQTLSAQNNRAALEHSLAVMLAEDMLERIRANPQGSYGIALGAAPTGFVDCLSQTCTSAQLAAFDAAVWKCSLGRWAEDATCVAARGAGALAARERQPGLPGGDGRTDIGPGGTITVAVVWGASRVVIGGAR